MQLIVGSERYDIVERPMKSENGYACRPSPSPGPCAWSRRRRSRLK